MIRDFMKEKIVVIKLTEKQYELLRETLLMTEDEGPTGEGWKSDELKELIDDIEKMAELSK
jgi:hypothetical protein